MFTKKIKIFISGLLLLASFCMVGLPAHAVTPSGGVGGDAPDTSASDPCHPENNVPAGSKLTASQLSNCESCNKSGAQAKTCLASNPIVKDINVITDALAGAVIVVVIGMIILGGIRYSIARNNPNDVSAARNRIINAIIALIFFMFIWALLQYLVPGGVFNS